LNCSPGRDDDDINTDYAESDVMINTDIRQNNSNSSDNNNSQQQQQQQKSGYREY
jgi:hypothetical protein